MAECSKGWGKRCPSSHGKKCRCACGGENHGIAVEKKTAPAADLFSGGSRLDYEGLHGPGAWVNLNSWVDASGVTHAVATDCSDEHNNTSITNRVERVAYLAWERLGKPERFRFYERYTGRNTEVDEVTFDGWPATRECRSGFKVVGPEFRTPSWKRTTIESEALALV